MKISAQFEWRTQSILIQDILPTRTISEEIMKQQKFQSIFASIREIGIIEPMVVHPAKGKGKHYILLDGHMRLEVLKQLGAKEAICLISVDDEGFTYNRQINRISPFQEHKMILTAIEKGVPAERIAQVLNINVKRVVLKQRLLEGIAPEAIEMLKERTAGHGVFAVLRRMKPLRQIEAVEMMISANCLTRSYAEMILAATKPEYLNTVKKVRGDVTSEEIERMEREMKKIREDYQSAENHLAESTFDLVVIRGYFSKVLQNKKIVDFLNREHKDWLDQLKRIMENISVDAQNPEKE